MAPDLHRSHWPLDYQKAKLDNDCFLGSGIHYALRMRRVGEKIAEHLVLTWKGGPLLCKTEKTYELIRDLRF